MLCYNVFVLADVSRKLRFNDVALVAIHNRITMCPKRAMSFYFRRLLGQLEPNGIALLAFQGVEHMREIPLTQGKVAIVDDDDFEELNKFKWYANANGFKGRVYAVRSSKKRIRMHRQIMGFPERMDIDHINGNTLDNRKSNLRIATRSQNLMNSGVGARNTSGYKGVSPSGRPSAPFLAQVVVMQKAKNLGRFRSAEEAARAYDKAAKELFGEFARLNFPEGKTK